MHDQPTISFVDSYPVSADSRPRSRERIHLAVVTETENGAGPMEDLLGMSPSTPLFTPTESSLLNDLRSSQPTAGANINPGPGAIRIAPPIPGLYFASSVRLPSKLAQEVMSLCMDTYFHREGVNQVMLFGRARPVPLPTNAESKSPGNDTMGLPPFLISLLSTLEELLLPILPHHIHSLLFPSKSGPAPARQVILNLYHPGEGISAHVDLLQRFGDGIIGLSLGGGCVMRFQRECQDSGEEFHEDTNDSRALGREYWDLYLPERSILVLSEDARYKWTHGIQGRPGDFVQRENDDGAEESTWIARSTRLSITFRWLLPGADIVGGAHMA